MSKIIVFIVWLFYATLLLGLDSNASKLSDVDCHRLDFTDPDYSSITPGSLCHPPLWCDVAALLCLQYMCCCCKAATASIPSLVLVMVINNRVFHFIIISYRWERGGLKLDIFNVSEVHLCCFTHWNYCEWYVIKCCQYDVNVNLKYENISKL